MHTKLTLRMDEEIIDAAKNYSKLHGKSLSQLVEDYFYLITAKRSPARQIEPLPPLTQSLKGILKRKKLNEADYKKHLEDKYL